MQKNYPQFNFFYLLIFLFFSVNSFSQSQSFSTPGTFTFTVPAGVYTIKVEAWGSGSAGHNTNNRGGGGGAFAGINAITVTPGSTYTVTVGAGAASGSGGNGQNSSFGTLVIAAGAIGGNGGTVASSIGTIRYAGGNGGSSDKNGGAGGGGSAGAGGAGDVGGNTSDNSGGTAGGAGIAGSGSAGAAGGVGGNNNTTGSSGTFPGGGGGEGGEGNASGGGGNGQVKIFWITVSASSPTTVCSGAIVNLTASALPLNPRGILLAEGFNSPTNNWTAINNSTAGTFGDAAWTLRPNDYKILIPKNPAWNYGIIFNSNDASQFYLSNSDAQGSAGTTQTILQSPVMSTVGYSSLSLDFYHYYQHYTGSYAKVEVSTDGTNWASIGTYTTTLGSSRAFAHSTITLGAVYLGVSSLYIRFKYDAPWGYWWAIDNVTVSGTRSNYDYSWSASPSGTAGLSAGAGTPSSSNASITVNPTATTIYTVTAASGDGLIGQISTTVTVNALPVISGEGPVCVGSTITLSPTTGGTWTSNNPAVATITNGGVVTGVSVGSTTFTFTATATGCSKTSASVTVNAFPATPTVGAITQPTCTTATGSVDLSGLPTGNWTINPGAIAGNVTSTTISGLLAGTYTFTVTNANGCTSLASDNVVINSSPTINYWNGSISSDWFTAGNWCIGVPNNTNNLINIIPVVTRYPIISLGTGVLVKNLEIQSGALLTINDNSLNVTTGILTLNGKIDLNNESQLVQATGSTFVGTGSIEIDQQGTSDNFRYNYWGSPVNSIGGISYTIAGVLRDGTFPNSTSPKNIKTINFGGAYTYADINITPTDDISTAIRLSTYWMYKFVNSGNGYGGWTSVGKDGTLKVGEGFTLKGSNTTLPEQNYTFVGKPNNGDINLTIDAGRQYLVGNPYPSALDARKFIKDNILQYTDKDGNLIGGNRLSNIIDGNLYFWDHFGGGTHYLKSYEGGYAIYNLSGGVNAVSTDVRINNTGNSSGKVPQKFIPVAQGFFVTALAGGDIQFKNSQRIFIKEIETINVSQFLKSEGKDKSSKETAKAEDVFPRIYLNYNSPKGFNRQLLAAFIPTTTDGIDIGYDAINGETFVEDMSWKANEKKLVIQAVPTLNEQRILPLYLKLAIDGIAKISVDIVENMPKSTKIFIKDNTTGETFDITEKPFEILLKAGVYDNRFALTFKTILVADENAILMNEEVLVTVKNPLIAEDVSMVQNEQPVNIGIHVFMNNAISELQINNVTNSEILNINLFNNVGQLVNSWNTNLNKRDISLPVHIATGIYNVQITTKNGTTVKKIMVE